MLSTSVQSTQVGLRYRNLTGNNIRARRGRVRIRIRIVQAADAPSSRVDSTNYTSHRCVTVDSP